MAHRLLGPHDTLPCVLIISLDIFTSSVPSKASKPTNLLNFSKGDYVGLCFYLDTIDLSPCLQSEDSEFIWSYLVTVIMDAIYKFVPTVPTRLNKQPIWFNSDIRHHTNCLRALKRNFNQHPTLYNKLKYENSSNLLQDKISSAKANYESNLIFTFTTTNNSKVYKYIRSLTKSHSTPPTLHYNSTTANCLFLLHGYYVVH